MKRGMVLSGLLAAVIAALVVCAATAGASSGYSLTLQWTPTNIQANSNVIFSGLLTNNGVGVPNTYVEVDEYDNAQCTPDAWYWDAWWDHTTTNASGAYTLPSVHGDDLYYGGSGHYYVQAYALVGESTLLAETPCMELGVTAAAPQVNHEFLCYSKWQVQPSVWSWSDAQTLLKQGYWLPTALDGNIAGGTNLGKFNLQCNVTPKGDGYVGASGEWWAGDWSAYAAANGGMYPH